VPLFLLVNAASTPMSTHADAASESKPEPERAQSWPAAGPGNQASRDLESQWLAMQAAVRTRMHAGKFETWFRRAALVHADDGIVRIAVHDAFSRGWLESYYRDAVEAAARTVFGSPRRAEFVVDPEALARIGRSAAQIAGPASASAAPAPITENAPATERANERTKERGRELAKESAPADAALSTALGLGLNPKYTFDQFVVGPCNRFAWAAAVGTAEAPGVAYNPFFLHGSVGLGKTHLLQSLCFSLLARNPRTRILYLSCETFVNHFISALERGDLTKFRTKYRCVDVLVVDDIHLLANKERTQEEFFHTFNALHQSGKQIVLSSDSPPRDIPTLQERLVSRFKWGLVTQIEPPCYETRMAILKRKSRDRGREVNDEVARLLADRIDSNIRELEGAVTKLLSYASLTGRQVTVDLAREALRELFASHQGEPSLPDIVALVTEGFNVRVSELQSKRRTNSITFPRQISMYIARQVTKHSLEEIGGFFGGRDHSTVIYAVEKIAQLMTDDPTWRARIEALIEKLRSTSA
jgi:chromosomal replication initiator protein